VTFQPPSAHVRRHAQRAAHSRFERGVIVHTMRYDIDHSLLIDELEALSPSERAN